MGPFHRGVVTTQTLKVGEAGDCDDRDKSLSAFLATRCSVHGMILPDYTILILNGNFCSRTLRPRVDIWGRSGKRLTGTGSQGSLAPPIKWG
jgi:hypothetical protein